MGCRMGFIALTLLALLPGKAFSQDSCDVESIVQPAIDDAATSSECNADGVYITPSSFGANADEKCTALSPSKCKKCVKEESSKAVLAFKYLVKSGFFEKTALADLKSSFKDIDCGSIITPTPTPEGEDGDNNSPGEGDNQPQPTPTPGTSPLLTRDQARHAIGESCPCHGQFTSHQQFINCSNVALSYLLEHSLITHDVGTRLYQDLAGSTCGQ